MLIQYYWLQYRFQVLLIVSTMSATAIYTSALESHFTFRFGIFFLIYNSHTMTFTLLKCMVFVLIRILVYSQGSVTITTIWSSEYFYYSKRKTPYPLAVMFHSLLPQPSMPLVWFQSLRSAYSGQFIYMKLHHVRPFVSGFFHLAQCLKIKLYCSAYQYFISFYGQIVFHCMDIPSFVYSILSCWTSVLFPFGTIMNNVIMNIHIHGFLCVNICFRFY